VYTKPLFPATCELLHTLTLAPFTCTCPCTTSPRASYALRAKQARKSVVSTRRSTSRMKSDATGMRSSALASRCCCPPACDDEAERADWRFCSSEGSDVGRNQRLKRRSGIQSPW
jgi:hypothetical protein